MTDASLAASPVASCTIRASLLLADFDCDPDEITAHLDLAPARVSRRGGGNIVAAWWTGARTGCNEWLFAPAVDLPVPCPREVALADLLGALREALEARRAQLATLPPCTGKIRIELPPRGEGPELAIASDDLDFLTDLDLPFSIDLCTAEAAA